MLLPTRYPQPPEVVSDRIKQGIGLTRPEIAVLLSYSKIVLYDDLLSSGLPDDPYFAKDLTEYFPHPLRKKYAKEISGHRLRREIIATSMDDMYATIARQAYFVVFELEAHAAVAQGASMGDLEQIYLDACKEYGTEPGLCMNPTDGAPMSAFVAKDPDEALALYQTAMIMHWACFEAVAVYGLVLCIVAGIPTGRSGTEPT